MEGIQIATNQIMTRRSKLILGIVLSVFGLVFLWTFFIKIPFLAVTIQFMELIGLIIISLILLRYYDWRNEKIQIDEGKKKSHKLKFILWTSLLIISGLTFTLIPFVGVYAFIILFFELMCLILLSFAVLKYYDLNLVFFLVIICGLFVKRLHWPLAAEEMTIGTLLLSMISIINSGRFLVIFRNNTFLKWFGFFAGIIIALFMTGVLFMNLHWSGNVRIFLILSGCSLFIIYVLGLVFTLPNSNYISWSSIERKVFFRAVLIPMVFIFALITLIVVFSDTYNSLMGVAGEGSVVFPYEINSIRLFDLEGILPI
jgi:hypothetical protein